MTRFGDSECWHLTDIRLSKYKVPNPYAGTVCSDDFCANMKPASDEESLLIKSMLRECKEMPDGSISWCTFDGIVRGLPEINGFRPSRWGDFDQAGYFSYKDGLEALHHIQSY